MKIQKTDKPKYTGKYSELFEELENLDSDTISVKTNKPSKLRSYIVNMFGAGQFKTTYDGKELFIWRE